MSLALRKTIAGDHVESQPEHESQPTQATSAGDDTLEYDDGLLAVAGPIMVLCYVLLLAIAGVTFFGSGPAFFAVVISMAFAAIYFTIPLVFMRIRRANDQRWRRDADHVASPLVETWTGSMRRGEAIVQIVSIPLAVLLGFALLALRWSAL